MLNLYDEAIKLRQQIELIKSNDVPFFSDDFPINACQHASQLFCYHLGIKKYNAPIKVVFGVSKRRQDEIGHWWVEIGDTLIDLTADQFNVIDDSDLSYKIRINRNYQKVYCCPKNESPHYKVFLPISREAYIWNLSNISEDYIDSLEVLYEHISI